MVHLHRTCRHKRNNLRYNLGDINSTEKSMQQDEFQALVKSLCEQKTLPQALDMLKVCEDQDIAEAALSLVGQFALAEVDGEQRIYHVVLQENEQGEEEEFVEHIMNEGDDVIKFVAWFFETMFEVKQKETYLAAGKTYKQPKRG
ncbi:hypothetical protein DEB41_15030 [Vibrio anguillarum]|uniref:Uncharacterized protein n=2 Tax=Vibrionaceae TaxID=641 RepID=A0AAW4ALL4_VIBAN|nr:hypothetical protein VAA_01286 [Vibrio anguillarum 775]AGU59344.1 hypothetical protein N175_16335 [Vibrio anguillarum M3]ASF94187.1 hypothetical protein CEA93_19635 [Vibrio anguillarum]MDQ2189917.1 hypothetical protein [Vibrio sp. A14(2019)]MDQ2195891.1 hypothetical protein [Vibrio sp. 2017_1457_11]NNN74662.1 hypothetical protein [Vibrio sp. B7]NNN91631.1 hypothetical protein [Vibrio sp. B8-1]NNO06753.1 hypothetical protein [Vibrio sp. B4-12]OXX36513.1 hypothetical protein B9J90_08200 [V